MILAFWMLSFKPAFSLSSFTFIKRLSSSSSLSAIRVISSACMRLLFLLEILIPACDSSSLVFHMLWPCRRTWQPTPYFCLENPMDRGAWWATKGCKESDKTEETAHTHALCIVVTQEGGQHTALSYCLPNFEPVSCSMSSSNCCFMTYIKVTSRSQVRWSGIHICLRMSQKLLQYIESIVLV